MNWDEISFHTNSSSEIYFHNMRSYYYQINEREKAPFILYRLKRGGSGKLSFMIIENRLADEAYVYAEWNDAILGLNDPSIDFGVESLTESDLLEFRNEDHFRFAAKCYRNLLLAQPIVLMDEKDSLSPLFYSKADEKNALMVLEDYFQLVNKN